MGLGSGLGFGFGLTRRWCPRVELARETRHERERDRRITRVRGLQAGRRDGGLRVADERRRRRRRRREEGEGGLALRPSVPGWVRVRVRVTDRVRVRLRPSVPGEG